MLWQKRWFQINILLLLAFVWGSSYILMKIGLKSFNSEQAGAVRIFIASLVLLPISIKQIKYLRRQDLFSLLIAGFIGSFLPAFLYMIAETRIDSALAGMLNSLTPVFTLIVGLLFHRTKVKALQIAGILLGFAGAAGLVLAGDGFHIGHFHSYALLVILATLCYAISINQIKSKLSHLNGVQVTALSFLFIGPVALVCLLLSHPATVLEQPGWPIHLLALAALAVVGTALAMLLMNTLLRYSSAIAASSVTYIIPVFAIMWGMLDGETITLHHLGCMGLVLAGVYLINMKGKMSSGKRFYYRKDVKPNK